MVGGLAALSIAYIPLGGRYVDYVWQLQQFPILNGIIKAGVTFPLAYHYLGGMRHLVRAATASSRFGRSGAAVHRVIELFSPRRSQKRSFGSMRAGERKSAAAPTTCPSALHSLFSACRPGTM